MYRILHCIQHDHDWALVFLAALLCIISCVAAVILLRMVRHRAPPARRIWLFIAGISTGFGIWSTHFVAMLAYKSDLIVGYAPGLTFLSLLLVTAFTTGGFALASAGGRWHPLVGGAIVGIGIGVMHYTGMAAIEMRGMLLWSVPYVVASAVFGIGFAALALKLTMHQGSRLRNAIAGSALLFLAVLSHHFIGMAALSVLPTRGGPVSDMLMSPGSLGVSIATIATSLLVLVIGAAMMKNRAEAVRQHSEREFRILVEGITDCAIYMLDADGRITSWNVGAQQLTGFTSEEAIGQEFWRLNPSAELTEVGGRSQLSTASAEGKTSSVGWRYRRDGSRFRAHITLERVLDRDGVLLGFAKVTRDMTQQHEDQVKLTKLASDFDLALSNMHHGLCLFDAEERLVLANIRVIEMFNLPPEVCHSGISFLDTLRIVLEQRSGARLTPEQLRQVYDRHRACIEQPGGGALVVEFAKDCILSIIYRPMPDGSWVSTYEDVTDRRRSEARITHMAMHDGLTGLPNREHLSGWFDGELVRAKRSGSNVAIVAIDLNRFKEINDTHGHGGGDQVLRTLADRFRGMTQENELVARFGGDEFAATKSYEDDRELADFVRRLEECFADRVTNDRFSIVPGASIGIAIYPQDGATAEQLLNNADLAMYRAKSTLGVQTCYFEPGMDEAHRIRRSLAQDMHLALIEDQFSLAYQVQRAVDTNAIVGYEALIRWNHPVRGNIPPADFIPVAEETRAIIEIGKWVLQTACAEAAGWAEPHCIAVRAIPEFG